MPLHNAWQSAAFSTFFNFVGMLLELQIGHTLANMPMWPPIISAALGAFSFFILVYFRQATSFRLFSGIYLVNIISLASAFIMTNPFYAANLDNWVPFQGAKLGCLLAGMLAPTFLVGLVNVVILGGSSLVQLATFPLDIQSKLPPGEAWTIAAFGTCGMVILVYRLKQVELIHKMQESLLKAELHKQLARSMLGVRDLMNTSLQNLEIASHLLSDEESNFRDTAQSIARAVSDLRSLSKTLAEHESKIDWTDMDVSFDARQKIRPSNPSSQQ
ncbi:MAG: hypothetical protein AB7F87_03510 [Oligoflexales bacterium]